MKRLPVLLSLLLSACDTEINQDVLIEKYTNIHSKFVQIDGNRVHYRDEGQGEVIVLLHGTASSLHTWDEWAKHLSKEFVRQWLISKGFQGKDSHKPMIGVNNMQIEITGHHVEVTDLLDNYIKDKVTRLKRHFDQVSLVFF